MDHARELLYSTLTVDPELEEAIYKVMISNVPYLQKQMMLVEYREKAYYDYLHTYKQMASNCDEILKADLEFFNRMCTIMEKHVVLAEEDHHSNVFANTDKSYRNDDLLNLLDKGNIPKAQQYMKTYFIYLPEEQCYLCYIAAKNQFKKVRKESILDFAPKEIEEEFDWDPFTWLIEEDSSCAYLAETVKGVKTWWVNGKLYINKSLLQENDLKI